MTAFDTATGRPMHSTGRRCPTLRSPRKLEGGPFLAVRSSGGFSIMKPRAADTATTDGPTPNDRVTTDDRVEVEDLRSLALSTGWWTDTYATCWPPARW